MKKLLFFLILINSTILLAQPSTALVWANNIKNPTLSYNYSGCSEIITDNLGNYFVTGVFRDIMDMDPSLTSTVNITPVSNGIFSTFVAKYKSNGNLQWVKVIGNSIDNTNSTDIELDANNKLVVIGNTRGILDIDPSASTYTLNNSSSLPYTYVVKLDTSGAFISGFNLQGNSESDGAAITADNLGNIYITGKHRLTTDFDPTSSTFNLTSVSSQFDMYYAKYNSSGALVWAFSYGTSATNEWGECIAVDNISGNIAIGGVYNNNGIMMILNSSGTIIKSKQLTVNCYGVRFDNLSNLYFSGTYGGSNTTVNFDLNTGTYNLLPTGNYNLGFVVKYNSAYNIIWGTSIPQVSQYINLIEIALDNSNDILFSGSESSTSSTSHIIFGKLNKTSGNIVWKNNITGFGSGGSNGNRSNGIAYSYSDGNVIVAGSIGQNFTNPCTIDADATASVYNLVTVSGIEIFMGKYQSCTAAPIITSSISGVTSICQGAVAQSYTTAVVSGANSYSWSLPSGWLGTSTTNTISATPSANSGNISVTASNACGTSTAQTLAVTVNPSPTITVNSGAICSGNNFTINPSGANTYTIQGGSSIVSPTANASYTVIGTSSNGCNSQNAATVNVTVNPTPTLSIFTNSTTICIGQSAALTASGASNYTWSTGSNFAGISVSPSVTSSYTVTGASPSNCTNTSITTITVNPLPTVLIFPSTNTICSGSTTTLICGGGATSYTWAAGPINTGYAITPTITSSYVVTGNDVNGCSNSATKTLTVIALPTINTLSSNSLICTGQSATLTASGANTYTWNTGGTAANEVITPSLTTNYTVTGTNAQGCSANAVITQSVSTCTDIDNLSFNIQNLSLSLYPNPTNGLLYINTSLQNATLHITNTLGQIIFNEKVDNNPINLQHLANGIYFVNVISENKIINKQKLIKE